MFFPPDLYNSPAGLTTLQFVFSFNCAVFAGIFTVLVFMVLYSQYANVYIDLVWSNNTSVRF